MPSSPSIKRALLSVSDKSGIVELARKLHEMGISIISTGGTATLLQNQHIPVTEVSDYTGFPEIMGGRVKTLHPKVHGGILRRPGVDDAVLEEHAISPIDLIVVNLYPFAQVVHNEALQAAPDFFEQAIENIDIGGPTMVRAAAKNHAAVCVVVDPNDYSMIVDELKTQGHIRPDIRRDMAAKAFSHTAVYDSTIATFLNSDKPFPDKLALAFSKKQELRYGENPHQQAAFYTEYNPPSGCIAFAEQLQGKELSFNNIVDSEAALECAKEFSHGNVCVIVKHANPCGIAMGENQLDAYQKAWSTDKTSAFGGIIAFNEKLLASTAQAILEQQFVEVIIAPDIEPEVLPVLEKKTNVRLLKTGAWKKTVKPELDYKRITGGLLAQEKDTAQIDLQHVKVVTTRSPTSQELADLKFAWIAAKYVKSNAIVFAKEGRTVGIGAGQMSRVYSARIAGIKAADEGLQIAGSVMASDAFFPFSDTVEMAAQMGVTAIIQPGGSMRDAEVIASANAAGLAMVFTGIRHFRH